MTEPKPMFPTLNSRWKIVIGLMITGVIFYTAVAPFVVLKPPYYQKTIFVYLVLLLAWIPAYFVLVRPIVGFPNCNLVFVFLGIMLVVGCCGMISHSHTMEIGFASLICEEQTTSPGKARYLCTYDSIEGHATYTIEGPDWSPILFVVDREVGSK